MGCHADVTGADGGRDFPGRRWLSVVLRALHLMAVMAFAAAFLSAQPTRMVATAVLVSGGLLWFLDLWRHPAYLGEGAGLSMLLKLLLLAGMVVFDDLRWWLFWTIVAWSAIFSHAPAKFRNARLIGRP